MGYLFLFFTVIFEAAAVIFMKLSAGFQDKWYSAGAVLAYALSFVFLTLSLKYLPAGLANALWAGASALLVAILGVFIFHEKINIFQAASLLLIIIGLLGLHVFEPKV